MEAFHIQYGRKTKIGRAKLRCQVAGRISAIQTTPARKLLSGVPPFILEHIANTGARMTGESTWEWKVHPSYYARSGFQQMVSEVGTPDNV